MQNLKIYNTLTRQKEEFKPLNPPYIGMYVCGPTVYNYVHLGNVRTFLTFDVLFRYLTEIGYKVRYVRNITDVGHLVGDGDEGEDKIGKMAKLEKLEPMEIVQRYTNDFHKVLDQFNFLPPSIEPTATGHLVEQIEAVQTLIDKGLAYESNGSVYFDINQYNSEGNDYGKLSGRILEDLLNETRELDGQSEKRNPLDFAIWKNASPEHIMQWKSPWGMGFPGWHLECTCMSTKYLGKQFDIHGGGMDLKFPHHECEIAQGVGITGVEPVRYWMHSNMLTVNGQKMSKSLGNSFLPSELFAGSHPLLDQAYSPMTVRFFMLQSQYRSTLDFSNDALRASQKGYRRLINGLRIVKTLTLDMNDKPAEIIPSELIDDTYSNEENTNNRLNSALRTITKYQDNLPLNTILGKLQTDHNYSNEEVEKVRIILLKTAPIGEEKPIDEKKKLDIEKTVQAFYEAMNDDLNTAVAIAQLFNLLKYVNMIYMNQLDPRALGDDTFNLLKEKFVLFMEQILGIKEETSTQTDGILNGMLSLYKEYKSSQRYDKVDEIRTYFKSNGMTIKDMKHRIDWAWEE